MGNLFDGMRDNSFDIVTNTMGYDATWIPSNGSQPSGYNARVLFKDPEADQKLSGATYSSFNYQMEYREPFFPGLKSITDSVNTEEQVTVNGLTYFVRMVETKADGKTYLATLELIA